MEFIIIFIAIGLIAYVVLFKTNHKIEQTKSKKEQMVFQYEKELQKLLQEAQTPQEQTQVKNQFLQKCNSELSRNIFFTKEESKQALHKLAQL
jgi:hypothetical protein